jgi:uncharacterized protein (TIGR00266 family)
MKFDVVHPGSNALVAVHLEPYESIQAQSGAAVSRTSKIAVTGSLLGGVGRALKRSFLGGESLFFQTLKAEDGEGEVLIAPAVPGDIKVLPLTGGQDYYVKNGSLLASFENVIIDTKMQKVSRGIFSGAGLFVIHAHGEGHIAVSAFGALIEVSVPAREKYIVDNGHLVAWFGDMEYRIVRGGKTWVSSVTSGEGLACEFTGPGKVWLQSRNPKAFGDWIKTFVPMRGGGVSIF